MTTYNDYPVFETAPDWMNGVRRDVVYPHEVLRGFGLGWIDRVYPRPYTRLEMDLVPDSPAAIKTVADFFDDRKGRLKPFWASSWQADIKVVGSFDAEATVIDIEDVDYETTWLDNDVDGRYLAFRWPDGTFVYRKVVDAPTATTIELDEAIGRAASDADIAGLLVSFLYFMRFDHDEIEIQYYTSHVAKIRLTMKSVAEEFSE
jgi:hypothetical protein